MTNPIRIREAEGTWVVRAAGAVIGETKKALELSEGSLSPVIYFPREDIAMAFLDPCDTATTCPHMGVAEYFNIAAKSGPIKDAAWSYPAPKQGVARIAGHIAFYPDKATIERI